MKIDPAEHFHSCIRDYLSKDFIQLPDDLCVSDALQIIRKQRCGQHTLVYFYVTNREGKLSGVLQSRLLLTAQPEQKIVELMIPRVIAIPESATVLDACEFFVLHKFLAFPVVNANREILGTVDINLFNEEVYGIAPTAKPDDLFQTLGFRISQVRNATPLHIFRYRFPWLIVTIGAGTACAFLTKLHERTLSETLVIAFFLTLVLALGESVCVQSLTVILESLRVQEPTRASFLHAIKREAQTALLLAISISTIVFFIVWIIAHQPFAAFAISLSIGLSLISACLLGISIPTLLHAAKLDLTIAAGPITLGITDIATLLIYLGLTSAML